MKVNRKPDEIATMLNDIYAEKIAYEFAKNFKFDSKKSVLYSSLYVRVRKESPDTYVLVDALTSQLLSSAALDYEANLDADRYITEAYYVAVLARIQSNGKRVSVSVINCEAFEN